MTDKMAYLIFSILILVFLVGFSINLWRFFSGIE